jgi:uncharacterized protein (TIGR04552 family)
VEEVNRFLAVNLFEVHDPVDVERLYHLLNMSVEYLESNFGFKFGPEIRSPPCIQDLFLQASDTRRRRSQIHACAVLKTMNIIHHVDSRELLFNLPISESELMTMVESRVSRCVGRMRDAGVGVYDFYGGRKSRPSLITKLLAKKSTLASAVLDKVRFRIVTETRADIIPAILFLIENLAPFNYTVPGQAENNLIDFDRAISEVPELNAQRRLLQHLDDGVSKAAANEFSGTTYRTVSFVTDLPVKPTILKGFDEEMGRRFGRVVFTLVEFQVIDRKVQLANETGDSAHPLYKVRQKARVLERLTWGQRRPKIRALLKRKPEEGEKGSPLLDT